MKRLLSFVLSAVMFVCATAGSCFGAYAGEQIYGIDVSEHNDLVNFTDAKDNGKEFVMIRLGYYNHLDEKFWDNVKNAYNSKMDFGVYLYSYAYSTAEATVEAEFVLKTLNQLLDKGYGEYFTLPVAYDLEEAQMAQKCSKSQITTQMTTFCDAIKNAGYVPMVYANQNWYTSYINLDTVVSKEYKIWYAYWQEGTPDFSKQITIGSTGVKADMWQYVDDTDKYSYLDKNVVYNSDEVVKPLTCCHTFDSGKVTKAATCTATGVKTYTCKQCGKTYTETIAKTAHTYKKYITPATTSKDGSTVNKCSVCGAKKSTSTIYKISSVALSTTSTYYNGSVKTPSVTVKNSRGTTLKKGTDYDVTYASGRKNVGRYAVTVKFKGNYSGSKTLYFNIIPKGISGIKKITASSKGFTVQWPTQKTQTTGYQIQYSTLSNFSNAKTITMGKPDYYAKKVTGLQGNKKYYVRIRTYKVTKFNGKNYNIYSPWCAAKSVTTKK